MLPVFFVGGGEGCGDVITSQRKKRMRWEAAQKARPAKKGNLRWDKGCGERRGLHPTLSRGGEEARPLTRREGWWKATAKPRPAKKENGGCDTATY